MFADRLAEYEISEHHYWRIVFALCSMRCCLVTGHSLRFNGKTDDQLRRLGKEWRYQTDMFDLLRGSRGILLDLVFDRDSILTDKKLRLAP